MGINFTATPAEEREKLNRYVAETTAEIEAAQAHLQATKALLTQTKIDLKAARANLKEKRALLGRWITRYTQIASKT